jgi:hypothetical protein
MCTIATVKLRPLLLGLLFAALAFSVGRALVTHDGVGAVEYVVGIALVALLGVAAIFEGRRAIHSG